jgi:hypothetical protein
LAGGIDLGRRAGLIEFHYWTALVEDVRTQYQYNERYRQSNDNRFNNKFEWLFGLHGAGF